MKLKCSRETLLQPLQNIIGVVERRQTLPILSNVLLATTPGGLEMTATDLEVQMVARLDQDASEPGKVTLPARKLMDICRALPEDASIELSVGAERATLKSGRSRFSLSTLPAEDFPKVEEAESGFAFTLSQQELKGLLEQTQFSMAQQDVRYYLNGLLFEVSRDCLRAIATDGHRLALCESRGEFPVDEVRQVIMPRKGVMELMRLLEDSETPVEIRVGDNHISVAMPRLELTSKLIDGRFPDYRRVIPQGGDKELLSDTGPLREALARTAILSNEKYHGVRLRLDNGTVRIFANNPDQEEAEEELEVGYSGEELEIGFNVRYLLDALAALPGDRVRVTLSDSNSSCLIETEEAAHCQYVVMPMRL